MRLVRVKLNDPAALLPMPDRGGRLFKAGGETVDAEHPFWMARLADREIIEVTFASRRAPATSSPAPEPVLGPADGRTRGAGRAIRRDGRSPLRPSAEEKSHPAKKGK